MKDWNQFLRLRKYYEYLCEDEVLHFVDDNQEAKNLYAMTCDKYELDEQERWYLAIALDCVKDMNEQDIEYLKYHLRSVVYHFGYAMEIRNQYLWHCEKHECYEPDGASGTIMEYIFSIVHMCRYKEGAELYSMGLTKFQELAKEAGAVTKYQGCALVDIDRIDEYLEGFRVY